MASLNLPVILLDLRRVRDRVGIETDGIDGIEGIETDGIDGIEGIDGVIRRIAIP
jgi:hypothetical protein